MTENIFLEDLEMFVGARGPRARARRVQPAIGSPCRHRAAPHGAAGRLTASPAASLPAIRAPLTPEQFRIERIRAILTEPDEEAPRASAIQRAAAISMTGVMTVAMPPLGGAMVVLNAARDADMRLSAQLTALGGLAIALRMTDALPLA